MPAWAYARLTKPRIVMLLVITTIPAMVLAEGGLPSVWLMLATVFGGSVVAGGANAMNMYFDRDIDELMLRTRGRPVPAGQIEPEKAAVFGMLLGAGGFLFLDVTVNLLDTAYVVIKAVIAIGLWGGAAVGYLWGPLAWYERIVAMIAAFLLVIAVPWTDEAGFALGALFALWHGARNRARLKAQKTTSAPS